MIIPIHSNTFHPMNYTKMFETFYILFRRLFTRTAVWRQQPPPPPPTSSELRDQEYHKSNTVVVSVVDQICQPPPPPPQPQAAPRVHEERVDQNHQIDWIIVMIGFCMESATDIALQSVQSTDQHPSNFHFLSLLFLFTFAAIFVARFIHSKFPITAQVLEGFGILLAVSAFCYAITIPFPYNLKCATWATFVVCFLVVLICRFCF